MNISPGHTHSRPVSHFVSLRTKLAVFLSVIIVVTCSGLSWYFIQNKIEAMTNQLIRVGTILVKNLAYNSRYGIFTEDVELLWQFIDGVMEVEQVVYVVITGSEGKPLAAKSKGRLTDSRTLIRSTDIPLYPNPAAASALFASTSTEPVITSFAVSERSELLPQESGKKELTPLISKVTREERLYDFAVPVLRRTPAEFPLAGMSLQSEESLEEGGPGSTPAAQVYGIVQVGVTEATLQKELTGVIRNVALITIFIIVVGIVATIVLAGRIITPLRGLVMVSRRIAEGELTASVEPTTHDEVGQLTRSFNQMTDALKDRDVAISQQISTITTQLKELTALNQIGIATTSTLDVEKLLTTVLHLLVEDLGFARILLMLYDSDRGVAYGGRVVGVSEEMQVALGRVELPVEDTDTVHAALLLRGQPILVEDISSVRHRMYPPILALAQDVGVVSFVGAPLRSKQRILGFLAGDKGTLVCTEEDLKLFTTIASNIGVAIDNALAYQQLEQLTQSLERRVQERTQELQTANESLRELDSLRSAFVSIVSHEIRTPMTAVKGYVENMLRGVTGTLTEKQSGYLTRAKYNIDRLSRMINDLLDLTRIESGRIELRLAPMSIPEVVADVVESVQTMVQEKAIVLEARHAPALPMVQADRDKVQQMLTNLIANAINFTPKGGEIRVESVVRDSGFVTVCVVDTGPGIPSHEVDKVFEKFYRGESVPVGTRGTGLGLSIVKSLVELHKGRIWVDSTTGKGSRFCFNLPIVGMGE